MRVVQYKITTKQLEVFETTSLAMAEKIQKEHPLSKLEVALEEVAPPKPQMSEARKAWIASGRPMKHRGVR